MFKPNQPLMCRCEDAPCCGCGSDEVSIETQEEFFDTGCPGSGDGTDDLADYNANEADDYSDEGGEDSYLDASYEDRFEIDYGD